MSESGEDVITLGLEHQDDIFEQKADVPNTNLDAFDS